MEGGQAGEAKPSGAGTTARHLHFSGRVQGVGFRWLVRGAAHEFNLVGWVKNLPDGRVEAWLEGESAQVEAALSRLACAGPPARVDRLEAVECPPMEHARFTVIR